MTESHSSSRLTRREFALIVSSVVGSVMSVLVGVPLIGYFVGPAFKTAAGDESKVPIGQLETYPIGEPKLFTFTQTQKNGWETSSKSYGVFVLREDEQNVTVYSNVCPHLGCRVNWVPNAEVYACPCHEAQFGIHGEVLYGPPPRPMDELAHEVDEEGNLYVLLEG